VTASTVSVTSTGTVTSGVVQQITPPATPAKPAVAASAAPVTSTVPVTSTGTVTNESVQPTNVSTASVKPAVAASTATVRSTETVKNQPAEILYAQVTANGYQLIDTTPKIVLTLLKTSAENYFIANNATVNGIVLKKNEDWFFEYYKDGKLISEKLLVKF
jgi:hypothetical protein